MQGKHKWIVPVLLTAILAILLLVLAVQRIDDQDIEIEGNSKYTKEEMLQFIFSSKWDRNPFVLYYKNRRGKTVRIPFVDQYQVKLTGFNHVKINVYEKKVIGYVKYMGTNMYFDKDGIVVESSLDTFTDVPPVTGLEFEQIILYEKLPVEDEEVFALILNTTQALQKYAIEVDKIYLSQDKQVTLYMGEIQVLLGGDQDIDDKVRTLRDISPKLSGLKGTLDIREYQENSTGYTFKKE